MQVESSALSHCYAMASRYLQYIIVPPVISQSHISLSISADQFISGTSHQITSGCVLGKECFVGAIDQSISVQFTLKNNDGQPQTQQQRRGRVSLGGGSDQSKNVAESLYKQRNALLDQLEECMTQKPRLYLSLRCRNDQGQDSCEGYGYMDLELDKRILQQRSIINLWRPVGNLEDELRWLFLGNGAEYETLPFMPHSTRNASVITGNNGSNAQTLSTHDSDSTRTNNARSQHPVLCKYGGRTQSSVYAVECSLDLAYQLEDQQSNNSSKTAALLEYKRRQQQQVS